MLSSFSPRCPTQYHPPCIYHCLSKGKLLTYRFFRLTVSFTSSKDPHSLQGKVHLPQPRIRRFPLFVPLFLSHLLISLLQHKSSPRNSTTSLTVPVLHCETLLKQFLCPDTPLPRTLLHLHKSPPSSLIRFQFHFFSKTCTTTQKNNILSSSHLPSLSSL